MRVLSSHEVAFVGGGAAPVPPDIIINGHSVGNFELSFNDGVGAFRVLIDGKYFQFEMNDNTGDMRASYGQDVVDYKLQPGGWYDVSVNGTSISCAIIPDQYNFSSMPIHFDEDTGWTPGGFEPDDDEDPGNWEEDDQQ